MFTALAYLALSLHIMKFKLAVTMCCTTGLGSASSSFMALPSKFHEAASIPVLDRSVFTAKQPALFFILLSLIFTALPAVSGQGETRLYLLRHAEKVRDGSDDPRLTRAGIHRARKLANKLDDAGVTRLYSTDWRRTRGTLAPLARRLGLETKIYAWQDEASVEAMIADCAGQTAVICGHSNSTPALVNRLLGEHRFESLAEDEFGTIFLVVWDNPGPPRVTVISY